jgi:hypothetical protein
VLGLEGVIVGDADPGDARGEERLVGDVFDLRPFTKTLGR